MTNTTTDPNHNPATLTALRVAAALAALGGLAQLMLGGMLISRPSGLLDVHGIIGLITMVLTVVAGITAGLWSRQGGNTGLMWHALGMAIVAVLQYGLGEMGQKWVHVVIGIVFVAGIIALAVLAYRKPYAGNPHSDLNESTHEHDHH